MSQGFQQFISKLGIGILVVVIASACGGGGGGGAKAPDPDEVLPTGDMQKCPYGPTDGEMNDTIKATIENAVANNDVAISEFFGKKYDKADVEAVLSISSVQTWKFVKRLGVQVFRVPANKDFHCEHFIFLPKVEKDLLKFWTDRGGLTEESTINNHQSGFLAGLYTPRAGVEQSQGPTIWIYQMSDRRVLVHEMMHHNFYKSRKDDERQQNQALRQAMIDADRAYRNYQTVPDVTALENLTDAVDRLLTMRHRLVSESAFEEIANEGMLLDLYVQDKLKFVSREGALESTIWYMKSSFQKGAQEMQGFDQIQLSNGQVIPQITQFIIDQSSAVGHPPWPDLADKAKAIRKRAQDLLDAAQAHIANAKIKADQYRRTHPLQGQLLGLHSLPSIDAVEIVMPPPANLDAHINAHVPAWARSFLGIH